MTSTAAIGQALDAYFDTHGWPAAGREVEAQTNGKVSSLSISRYAMTAGREHVAALGAGLYAPADRARLDPVPLSRNMALALLDIGDQLIDDHSHLRIFKIAMILARKGYATIRISRTTRQQIRRQTMRVSITDAGRAMLEAKARLAKDEF